MNEHGGASGLAVGSEIEGPVRVVTPERIEWYDSAMLSAAKGELARVAVNIHTDEEYAKTQGLTGIIADGMISTNWISSMLLQRFGMAYLENASCAPSTSSRYSWARRSSFGEECYPGSRTPAER